MPKFLKFASLAVAAGLAAGSAHAIDPFFPSFGNKGIDVVHYDLDLDVNPESGFLAAKAALKVVALADLSRFRLDRAGLDVTGVSVDGDRAGFRQADDKLIIAPRSDIAKGDVFNVTILYSGVPEPIQDPTAPGDPSYKLGWFKYRNSTYALSEPVGASTFYPANDEPTDKASFKISVTVPAGYTGVANGVLTNTTDLGSKKQFVWNMRQPITTWLATVHVNRFNLRIEQAADGTPIRTYYTDKTPREDVDNYALAKRMFPFFELRVGNYPFDGYGSVVVDDPALYYALETAAMSTFPVGFATEAVVAHELAHQWFGNSVAVAQWRDLWIAEGAATYFEVLWGHRNDPAGFDAEMRAIYDYAVEEEVGPAVVEKPEQLFTDRTYLRGALALYALRLKVGDRTFFNILRRFANTFKGGNATSKHFIETAVTVSRDNSVHRLLRNWLYEEPVPPLAGDGARAAKRGPVARPDIFGLSCGPVRHRGAHCGHQHSAAAH